MAEFACPVVCATVKLAVDDDSSANPFAHFNEDDVAEAGEVGSAEPDFPQSREASSIVEVQRNVTQLRLQNIPHFDALTPAEALRFADRSGFMINQSDQADADTSEFAMRTGLPGEGEGLLSHSLEETYR